MVNEIISRWFFQHFKKPWKGNTRQEGIIVDKNYLLSLNWPPALLKAMDDPFEYLVTLRTGEEIYFTNAKYLNSDFVKLDGVEAWPRGIEVRVSDIMYIADAPSGI